MNNLCWTKLANFSLKSPVKLKISRAQTKFTYVPHGSMNLLQDLSDLFLLGIQQRFGVIALEPWLTSTVVGESCQVSCHVKPHASFGAGENQSNVLLCKEIRIHKYNFFIRNTSFIKNNFPVESIEGTKFYYHYNWGNIRVQNRRPCSLYLVDYAN